MLIFSRFNLRISAVSHDDGLVCPHLFVPKPAFSQRSGFVSPDSLTSLRLAVARMSEVVEDIWSECEALAEEEEELHCRLQTLQS